MSAVYAKESPFFPLENPFPFFVAGLSANWLKKLDIYTSSEPSPFFSPPISRVLFLCPPKTSPTTLHPSPGLFFPHDKFCFAKHHTPPHTASLFLFTGAEPVLIFLQTRSFPRKLKLKRLFDQTPSRFSKESSAPLWQKASLTQVGDRTDFPQKRPSPLFFLAFLSFPPALF